MGYLKTKIISLLLLLGMPLVGYAQSFMHSYIDPCTGVYKTIMADMNSPIIVTYYGQVKSFTFEQLSRGDLETWMNNLYQQYKNTSPCQGIAITTLNTNTTTQTLSLITNITNITNLDFSLLTGSINVGSTINQSNTVDEKQNNESDNQQKEEITDENDPNIPITINISKSKQKVKKPSILITGDIVGVQNINSNQDARGTMSFTKIKGDGTSSLNGSLDYMINARIGNLSIMKSWISINDKGHKSINVVSNSFTLLPSTWSNTVMFVRVNSLTKFTALYGAAATYGIMFDEPLINTLAIGGFMYRGNLTKSVDATLIMVGVYSPYMKYYTESILKQQPVAIPFLNLTYKLTKTFGFGLTGGGTYITGSDQPLNYQILLGAKLLL